MDANNLDLLTPRQRECLEARKQRRSAKQIGRILGISHHTVHMHWRLARMRLANRNQAPLEVPAYKAVRQLGGSAIDPDIVLILRQTRRLAQLFFFWVGVLATTAFVMIHLSEGMLLLTGRRVQPEQTARCEPARTGQSQAVRRPKNKAGKVVAIIAAQRS